MSEFYQSIIALSSIALIFVLCFWFSKFYYFLKEWEWWLKSINSHIYDVKAALEKMEKK